MDQKLDQRQPGKVDVGALISEPSRILADAATSGITSLGRGLGSLLTPSRVTATPNRDGLDTSGQVAPAPAPAATPAQAGANPAPATPTSPGVTPAKTTMSLADITNPKNYGGGLVGYTDKAGRRNITNLGDDAQAVASSQPETLLSGMTLPTASQEPGATIRQAASVSLLPNATLADSQAIHAKWDMENQLNNLSPRARAQVLAAMLNKDASTQNAQTNAGVAMRGQDINSEMEASKLAAGAEVRAADAGLKNSQVSASKKLQELQGRLLSTTDPAEQKRIAALIMQLQGREPHKNFSMTNIGGGQVIDPASMLPVTQPSGVAVLNNETGEFNVQPYNPKGAGAQAKISAGQLRAAAKTPEQKAQAETLIKQHGLKD